MRVLNQFNCKHPRVTNQQLEAASASKEASAQECEWLLLGPLVLYLWRCAEVLVWKQLLFNCFTERTIHAICPIITIVGCGEGFSGWCWWRGVGKAGMEVWQE